MTASKYKINKICCYCGKEFEAQKCTTRFCSLRCSSYNYKEEKRIEKKLLSENQTAEKKAQPIRDLQEKEFLNVAKTAVLLGISRKTVYNLIYAGKLKAKRLTSRLTIISKNDIIMMLQIDDQYQKIERPNYNEVTETYTIVEICGKYHLKPSRIWKIIADNKIPKNKIGKMSYISKKHVDNFFSKHHQHKNK